MSNRALICRAPGCLHRVPADRHTCRGCQTKAARDTAARTPTAPKRVPQPDLSDGSCFSSPWPDLWFSDDTNDRELAVQTCGTCPVAAACLAYALEAPERHGVWGGKTENQRDRIKRGRAVA